MVAVMVWLKGELTHVESGLRASRPIEVHGLFQPDRDALLGLLEGLSEREWALPTVCAAWDVKDVALHVLGGDLGNISRRRDGVPALTPRAGERLGELLERINREWVEAARRFSPRLIVDLLRTNGPPLFAYLEGSDPSARGGPVSWAGPGPAPVWLDVAREYMERWVHQQHIRDAVGRPGQAEARFVAPVIAASMHALPVALASHAADTGASVVLEVRGDAGGTWSAVNDAEKWCLFEGATTEPRTRVTARAEDWWRVVTLGLSPQAAWERAEVVGDPALGRAVMAAVAIVA